MRDHDLVAGLVAELCGHIGADHRIEQVAERPAGREFQRPAMPVMVELEVFRHGAHHSEAAMAVAQRNRHDPVDLRPAGDVLVGFPGDVVGRVADAEHGVEQEIEAAAARPHDQIGAGDCVGEALPRARPHLLDAQQQRHAERDGEDRKQRRELAVGQRLQSEAEDDHLKDPLTLSLSRGGERERSNYPLCRG